MYVCLAVSASVCLVVCLCISLCTCVCVPVCLCVCLSVSMYFCVCVQVASSDASNIAASIHREGSDYVINAHKWWISGHVCTSACLSVCFEVCLCVFPTHAWQPFQTISAMCLRSLHISLFRWWVSQLENWSPKSRDLNRVDCLVLDCWVIATDDMSSQNFRYYQLQCTLMDC